MHAGWTMLQDRCCLLVAPSAKKVALIFPCAFIFAVKEGGRLIVLFLGTWGGTQVCSEDLGEWSASVMLRNRANRRKNLCC